MRILWFGDVAASGFGTVTTDVGREFLKLGVDVRFVSQNDLPGELPEPFGSRTMDLAFFQHELGGVSDIQQFVGCLIDGSGTFQRELPVEEGEPVIEIVNAMLANGEPWGTWKPDAIILLGDFAAARMVATRFAEQFQKVPCFHYVPIEGVDLPPKWGELWSWLKPIAMSQFGQREIASVTGEMPPMIYHGVDTAMFRPVSPREPLILEDSENRYSLSSKEACKHFFGGDPRRTWILRTDRHMPRKGYNMLLRSMVPVLQEHPETDLVLHCRPFDQGGFLPDTISKLPPEVRGRIIMTNMSGIPRPVLVALYNAADIYVSVSAEGFGLTIAEALACGVPAVGIDYSAVPEVIGPAGSLVRVARTYDNEYDHFWALPDETEFGEAVSYLIDHPAKRRALGAMGPKHVSDNFRWDEAAAGFLRLAGQALEPLEVAA